MNSIELKESIIDIIQAGLVASITSSPGLGKSAIVGSIAKQFELDLIDIRLSQCDPTELNNNCAIA
jgi:MoxR-like ATPase